MIAVLVFKVQCSAVQRLTGSRGEQKLHGSKSEYILLHRVQAYYGQFKTHFEQKENDS